MRSNYGRSSRFLSWAVGLAVLMLPHSLLAAPPNIVFILTDDQRWDTLPGVNEADMPQDIFPEVKQHLIRPGVVFSNAFAGNPVCCPMRAGLLSGGFSCHATGVVDNDFPNGGASRFVDRLTLATLLRDKGYRTAFIGKYLNGYFLLDGVDGEGGAIPQGRYIPPGWSVFLGQDNNRYDRYDFTVGASGVAAPTAGLLLPEDRGAMSGFLDGLVADGFPPPLADYLRALDFDHPPYVTTFQQDAALAFITDAQADRAPFCLIVAVNAPHTPAIPSVEDEPFYPGYLYRGRGWGESDLSDKPDFIQQEAEGFDEYYDGTREFASGGRNPDQFFADQLRTLRAVDRLVGAIVTAVEADAWSRDQTAYVFASDNGYQWGEHRVFQKRLPYEESIRVPLVFRVPGTDAGRLASLVPIDLDVPATLLEIAGYTRDEIKHQIGSDGRSLIPQLNGGTGSARRHVLSESFRLVNPSWGLIRDRKWKYARHDTGEEELYALGTDPHEQTSLHDDTDRKTVRRKTRLSQLLDEQRGLLITAENLIGLNRIPNARLGEPYAFQIRASGGTPPLTFGLYTDARLPDDGECTDRLPAGVELTPDGRVTGAPTETGCFVFWPQVEDRSVSRQNDRPQRYIRKLKLIVE
ncbi:MAG: hypothetical protein FLDDKLPJ_00364 [Phycisphaerae bacterium]|nr:hypothetical protein [Phycisphaerae bacterium]